MTAPILRVVPENPGPEFERHFACDYAPGSCARCLIAECVRPPDPRVDIVAAFSPPQGPGAA